MPSTTGLSFRGFESSRITEFFSDYYPDTPFLPAGEPNSLIVHRDEASLAQDLTVGDPATVLVLVLTRLLDLYRITKAKIDLKGF